jgi:hypothetical protein
VKMLAPHAPGAGRVVEDRLTFTPHALVRYIERHVDARGVRDLRRAGLTDTQILTVLRPQFSDELRQFVERFERVYDSRSCQCRNVTSGLSYRLHLGHVRIVVCCGRQRGDPIRAACGKVIHLHHGH